MKDIVTQSGSVQINDSRYAQIKRDTEDSLNSFVRDQETGYSRLYQNMKRLREDIASVASTIDEIKECIDQIGSNH